MRKCWLILMMACAFTSAKSQNFKMKGDSLAAAYNYLFKLDSIPANELPWTISSKDQWKGIKIDSLAAFDVYQMPVDRMICLVPNKNNPAKANIKRLGTDKGPGQMPNVLQPKAIIRSR